jgi:hypothetical protein
VETEKSEEWLVNTANKLLIRSKVINIYKYIVDSPGVSPKVTEQGELHR